MANHLVYHYDLETGEFLYARPPQKKPNGEPILDVLGATSVKPLPARPGKAIKWNGNEWKYTADHRQQLDEYGTPIPDTGTPYWLPGDSWDTPPRFMTVIGRLPNEALLSPPPKPQEQHIKEELERLGLEMLALEQKAIRYSHEITLSQISNEKPNPDDVERFKEIRESIQKLRQHFRDLKGVK